MAHSNDNPFEGSEITTILVVKDIDISKSFYLNILGASVYRGGREKKINCPSRNTL